MKRTKDTRRVPHRRAAIRNDIRARRQARRLWARTLDDATISQWVRGIARRSLDDQKRNDRTQNRVRYWR